MFFTKFMLLNECFLKNKKGKNIIIFFCLKTLLLIGITYLFVSKTLSHTLLDKQIMRIVVLLRSRTVYMMCRRC